MALTKVYNGSSWIPVNSSEVDVGTLEARSNKVTSLSSSSTDTEYPSAKCVYDAVGAKGDMLVSDYDADEDVADAGGIVDYVDNRLDGLTFLRITQDDYDALESVDDDTLYIIVEDE